MTYPSLLFLFFFFFFFFLGGGGGSFLLCIVHEDCRFTKAIYFSSYLSELFLNQYFILYQDNVGRFSVHDSGMLMIRLLDHLGKYHNLFMSARPDSIKISFYLILNLRSINTKKKLKYLRVMSSWT